MNATISRVAAVLCALVMVTALNGAAIGTQRLFSPKDDVELTLFNFGGSIVPGGVIKFSPSGRYFVVLTETGRLDLNAPEDTLWLFDTTGIAKFLAVRSPQGRPRPVRLARMSAFKDGPQISDVKWLDDSSAIAFRALERSACCKYHRLFVVSLSTRQSRPLTPADHDVTDFDIRSQHNFVYVARAPELISTARLEYLSSVGTGQSLSDILFPGDHVNPFNAAGLWAMVNGNLRHVLKANKYESPNSNPNLSLSPDGKFAVALIKATSPRNAWLQYQPPPGYRRGPLDINAYHLIDLRSGVRKLLVDAPAGLNQDWHTYLLRARWSSDGQRILLPNTFIPLDSNRAKNADRVKQPYLAVLDLKTGDLREVLALRAGLDKQRFAIADARLDGGEVFVDYDRSHYLPLGTPSGVFKLARDGTWQPLKDIQDPRIANRPISVSLNEGIDQPPVLMAALLGRKDAHLIWDPNSQLRGIDLGSSETIRWKDDTGYHWQAGLVKPPDFSPRQRYPLVIQTHGFLPGQFLSNGIFTSAFAARSLAARGILVVQMGWDPTSLSTTREGSAQVEGFRSLVESLARKGIVDPSRVGAIGFSRSVFQVLFALTAAPRLFAAASITDGINAGYFEYLYAVDTDYSPEADAINGAAPFGTSGLTRWLRHSPEFNMTSVRTPLLSMQPGIEAALADWGPYAALRYLNRPVELLLLQSGSHVMTNPRQRLASEATNVDWFRFWLQGYEDPDIAKREQYARWEKLCDLQIRQVGKAPTYCIPSHH